MAGKTGLHPVRNSFNLRRMNIILIGYRGTGKSLVGRLLARQLNRNLQSLDQLIVEKAEMPIPQIVARWGWPKFRKLESEVVQEVCRSARDDIIDCGGGVVLDRQNVDQLRKSGRTVLLTADFDVLLERLQRDRNRPALVDGVSFEEEQRRVLEDRQEKYNAAADFICDTSHCKPEDAATRIIKHFREQGWVKV